MEKHSAVYISFSENPILFSDNTFESNTGVFGGAFSIDTPNFMALDFTDDSRLKPFIVIQRNTFQYNQAYLSGNAVYTRFTRQRGVEHESKQACGTGIEFKSNKFYYNAPIIQASNGGAVSLECDFVSLENTSRIGASNDLFTSWNNVKTIFDPEDSKKSFTIFSSAVAFRTNEFKSNYIGQKGSAIYARQITFLMVDQNIFDSNGPAYQYN